MAKPFKDTINLDVRHSVPDWDAFTADRAPDGAPNVLVVLCDDTGCAAWSPYDGRIEMPTLQRLADKGLTYSQWHTTALCSPTRSTFLTGRNHHSNGFASISESSTGFPGYSPHIPREDGYHLSKDLADQALRFIRDSKQSEPDKPWYLWFCPGANHAPHHSAPPRSARRAGCARRRRR